MKNSILPLSSVLFCLTLSACVSSKVVVTRDQPEAEAVPESDDRPCYVYFIHPARVKMIDSATEDESAKIAEHFQYLQDLLAEGTLLLAGPSTEPPYTGIVIFRAENRQAAERILKRDPAVAAGVFNGRVSPFSLSLYEGRP